MLDFDNNIIAVLLYTTMTLNMYTYIYSYGDKMVGGFDWLD